MTAEDNSPSGWDDRRTLKSCDPLPLDVQLMLRGREPRSPLEGFGRLRLRTYRVCLPGIELSPARVFKHWLAGFAGFWPKGNHFIPCEADLSPGVTAALLLTMPAGLRVVTGARVLYMDDTSMTLETLTGHMFAGWITFSVFDEEGELVVQTQALVRPGDSLYELTFLFGFGQRAEDKFWHAMLKAVAQQFGVSAKVEQEDRAITRSIQWRYFGNIWYNAVIRSFPRYFGRSFEKILNR